jgi:hypothetical protein
LSSKTKEGAQGKGNLVKFFGKSKNNCNLKILLSYIFSSGNSRTKENLKGSTISILDALSTLFVGMVNGSEKIKIPVPAIPATIPSGLAKTKSKIFHSSLRGSLWAHPQEWKTPVTKEMAKNSKHTFFNLLIEILPVIHF